MPEPPPAEQPGHGIGIEPPQPKVPPVLTRRDRRIGAGIAAALLLACAGFSIWGGNDGNDAAHARVACEEGVKDRLVSPASADFSGVTVTASGAAWTVTGAVDSDNAFGASIRNTFTCRATLDGDTWELRITGLTR